MTRIFIIFLISTLIGACGFYVTYQGSKPTLAEDEKRTSIVRLSELDLNIRPYNDVRDFFMVQSPILVPVYITGKDKAVHSGQEEFFMLFGYRVHGDGFEFKAEKVKLLIGDERLGASVEHEWKNPVSKWGDEWRGFCGSPVPKSYQRISREPLPKNVSEFWHCYKLRFDISPPAPSVKFGLSIEGMSKFGTPYPIPVIWFKDYTWRQVDSVP